MMSNIFSCVSLPSCIIREMQIRTAVRCHLTPLGRLLMKRKKKGQATTGVGGDGGKGSARAGEGRAAGAVALERRAEGGGASTRSRHRSPQAYVRKPVERE